MKIISLGGLEVSRIGLGAMTMAGGVLSETHANRRTDYAMVTDSADDLANAADYPAFLDRMGDVFVELRRVRSRRAELLGE